MTWAEERSTITEEALIALIDSRIDKALREMEQAIHTSRTTGTTEDK